MIIVVAAIIRHDRTILITRRPKNVHLASMWEFPGGKVEPGETLEEALAREIREELGVEIEGLHPFYTTEHQYAERAVRLHFFECRIAAGSPQALKVADLRWVTPTELQAFEFPEADRPVIRMLREARTDG